MSNIQLAFWKIFGFFAFLGTWAEKSLKPDEDNVVRLTPEELAELGIGFCDVFGFKAIIVSSKNGD